MARNEILLGAGGADYVLTDEYHGFRLGRHSSGMGTVIEYKAADASIKHMLVLDAAFRSVQKFGTYGVDVPSLTNFQAQNKNSTWLIDGGTEVIPDKEPMPSRITNDLIYDQWAASLASDKTARENCDIWMQYNNQTDSKRVKGVPAVAWCRNQLVDGVACNLPNKYELMILWTCGDKLDEMDPTAASYPSMKLGYTSTGSNSEGRWQKYNGVISRILWSSTEYDAETVQHLAYNGSAHHAIKLVDGGVVPILELD